MNLFCLDIESLATPENSGYGIVVPNYAIVQIPEVLTHDMPWMYVQLPIQDQLDNGLKMDARTLDFWFNICAQQFPLALCEMQKSFNIQTPTIHLSTNDEPLEVSNVPSALAKFIGQPSMETKVFGNGCHFDCSILQENHRVMFNNGTLWHYSSPNNVRTLRLLMSEQDELEMKEAVQPHLDAFCDSVNEKEIMFPLCLHNPLFDAAKEALFTSYMMEKFKTKA